MRSTAVIISGQPASGKTTLARTIATELKYPLLDKDIFLERLFEESSLGVRPSRKVLSRMSDSQFKEAAKNEAQAVLVSHWRPFGNLGESGTPTEWLSSSFQNIVEVYCHCNVESAATRFHNRKRHEGHQDGQKRLDEAKLWLDGFSDWYPLSIGPV